GAGRIVAPLVLGHWHDHQELDLCHLRHFSHAGWRAAGLATAGGWPPPHPAGFQAMWAAEVRPSDCPGVAGPNAQRCPARPVACTDPEDHRDRACQLSNAYLAIRPGLALDVQPQLSERLCELRC